MEVAIDRENCGSCQLCTDACPEVFDVQQGEIVTLCDDVYPDFQADCRLAADLCPTGAIVLMEATDRPR